MAAVARVYDTPVVGNGVSSSNEDVEMGERILNSYRTQSNFQISRQHDKADSWILSRGSQTRRPL
jgi:hypothetical protein